MEKFEQLELDGILEDVKPNKVVEKPKKDVAREVFTNKLEKEKVPDDKVPHKKAWRGSGFVKWLEEKSTDNEWKNKKLKEYKNIDRKDLL